MRPVFALVLAASAAFLPAQNTNLALGGTATMSSTAFGGIASYAIDGNRDGEFYHYSTTHTNNLPNDWWQVVLAAAGRIDEVVLYNRADCCGNRLYNIRVKVLNGAAQQFSQDFFTSGAAFVAAGHSLHVSMPVGGVIGDTVRVEKLGAGLDGTLILSLSEVEVLQYGALPEVNLARRGVASQSTTAAPFAASKAIDGTTDGMFGNNSVSQTGNVAGSWWRDDLPWLTLIDEIRIWNRTDAFTDRLSNFRVSVFVDTVEIWGQDFFTTTGAVGTLPLLVPLPSGIVGNAVQVTLLGPGRTGEQALALAEVEIIRYGLPAACNLFGTGCAGSLGVPVLDAVGNAAPVIGTTFPTAVSNVPSNPGFAIIALGLSNRRWQTVTLPMDLGVFGAPGCLGLISLDVNSFQPAAGNTATLSLPIPSSMTLLGVTLYEQALVLDSAAGNALNAVVSNGAQLLLGN